MNKYLRLYFIDSLIVILILGLILYFGIDQVDMFGLFASGIYFPVQIIFTILGALSLLINIVFCIMKRNFVEKNLLFPKFYLIFTILLIIFAFIYNRFALIKYIHIPYYYMFLIIGYVMMSIYTNLSFKKGKEKE